MVMPSKPSISYIVSISGSIVYRIVRVAVVALELRFDDEKLLMLTALGAPNFIPLAFEPKVGAS